MVTESSQYTSPVSSSLSKPQRQNLNPDDYMGSFITLVSNCGLRYEGVLYHLNTKDKTLGLLNVICYGTEDRKNDGFQVLPSNEVFSYIVFSTSQIMNVIVKPPTRLTRYDYHFGSKAIRAAISSKLSRLTKPSRKFTTVAPLPYTFNEELNKTEATTDSDDYSVKLSVNDGLQIAWDPLVQPQYPGSNYYEFWLNHAYQSMPCDAIYQDPTNAASSLISSEPVFASQSFFTTFPPVPISFPPVNGGFNLEALTNFKQYELWGPQGDNNQGDQTAYTVDWSFHQNETWGSQGNDNHEDKTAYTIDGSSYMISHKPFDPIGRPCNPFGPIEALSYLPSSDQLADLGFV